MVHATKRLSHSFKWKTIQILWVNPCVVLGLFLTPGCMDITRVDFINYAWTLQWSKPEMAMKQLHLISAF